MAISPLSDLAFDPRSNAHVGAAQREAELNNILKSSINPNPAEAEILAQAKPSGGYWDSPGPQSATRATTASQGRAPLRSITARAGDAAKDYLAPKGRVGKAALGAAKWGGKGLAKVIPGVGVAYEGTAALGDLMDGQFLNKLDKSGNIDRGFLHHAAGAVANAFGPVGTAVDMASSTDAAAKHLLNAEDRAAFDAQEAARVSAQSAPGVSPEEEADMQQRPQGNGAQPAQGVAPAPRTQYDVIQEMLDDAMLYKGATDTEPAWRKELVKQATDPNEKYTPYAIPDENAGIRENMRERYMNWANSRHPRSILVGEKLSQGLKELTDARNQQHNIMAGDVQNIRGQHGYDKQRLLELHNQEQDADISREQNRMQGQANLIGRASTLAGVMRDTQKALWDRKSSNRDRAMKLFEALGGEDKSVGAKMLAEFDLKNSQLKDENGNVIDAADLPPGQYEALISQHIDAMKNVEGQRNALPFWSSTPVSPLDADIRKTTAYPGFLPSIGGGMSPYTAAKTSLKGLVGGNTDMAVGRGGVLFPIGEASDVSRQRLAEEAALALKSGKLSAEEARAMELQLNQALGR
jgi:hypothetical protein